MRGFRETAHTPGRPAPVTMRTMLRSTRVMLIFAAVAGIFAARNLTIWRLDSQGTSSVCVYWFSDAGFLKPALKLRTECE